MSDFTPQRRLLRISRKELDDAFPTVVRYLGIGLIVVFVGCSAVGVQLPESILVAATGLILYKTVRGNGNGQAP